jgi:antitoxin component HigA of HigAB toxin-antitoxin module
MITEAEYEVALQTVEEYFGEPLLEGSPEYDHMGILLNKIEEFENHHYPMGHWENEGGK